MVPLPDEIRSNSMELAAGISLLAKASSATKQEQASIRHTIPGARYQIPDLNIEGTMACPVSLHWLPWDALLG